MIFSLALLLGGLMLLAGGGEVLVRSATSIARIAGLHPAVIGLTVVAMGTSLPELVVSVMAALNGQPDLALGNVVGSNIFNITAALGFAALITPLAVHGNVVRREWPVLFGAALLCVLMLRDARVTRLEGVALLALVVVFTVYSIWVARREATAFEKDEFAQATAQRSVRLRSVFATGGVLAGIFLLVVGGRLLVEGAVQIARLAGMSERVIGLTVVAIGTGLPELVTSTVAALRRQTDVAVANMVGSNIFNVLGILGTTAAIRPMQVSASFARADLYWMLGTSLLLLPVLIMGGKVTRFEGALLCAVYVVYVVLLLR